MLIADSDISDAKMKLEMLRKGCCHPQVWDKDLSRRKGTGQGLVARPFDEIMILKVEQSRVACEERQRELVYHLNSLAGVAVLEAQLIITGQSRAMAQEHAQAQAHSDAHSVEVHGAAEWDSESINCSIGFQALPSPRESQPDRLCASDHLSRALRAYAYAYSFLERNRQTCPVLGLVRVTGTPEGSFKVLRAKRDEEHAEQEGSDIQENLLNVELRADQLSFSWSGAWSGTGTGTGSSCLQLLARAADDVIMFTTDPAILTATPRPSPSIQMGTSKGMILETADEKKKASTIDQIPLNTLNDIPSISVHNLNLFSSDRSKDMPVCAKMAFGAGRRLQQLKIQTKLPSLLAEMRAIKCRRGGNDVRVVLLFPQGVSLLAASGIADAFTRVACFDLALPSLTNPTSASCDIIDHIFPLNSHSTFSDETVRNFPLSFRARSWKLDVLSVQGICLEVQLSSQKPQLGLGLGLDKGQSDVDVDADMDVKEGTEGQGASTAVKEQVVTVTGQWRRTLDCLSSLQSSPSLGAASLRMSIGVDLFEATFDVDTFQVRKKY